MWTRYRNKQKSNDTGRLRVLRFCYGVQNTETFNRICKTGRIEHDDILGYATASSGIKACGIDKKDPKRLVKFIVFAAFEYEKIRGKATEEQAWLIKRESAVVPLYSYAVPLEIYAKVCYYHWAINENKSGTSDAWNAMCADYILKPGDSVMVGSGADARLGEVMPDNVLENPHRRYKIKTTYGVAREHNTHVSMATVLNRCTFQKVSDLDPFEGTIVYLADKKKIESTGTLLCAYAESSVYLLDKETEWVKYYYLPGDSNKTWIDAETQQEVLVEETPLDF